MKYFLNTREEITNEEISLEELVKLFGELDANQEVLAWESLAMLGDYSSYHTKLKTTFSVSVEPKTTPEQARTAYLIALANEKAGDEDDQS